MASSIHNMASENSAQVELAQYTQNPSAASSTDVQPLPNGTLSPDSHEGFSLPPTDTGKDAWLFLLACFMLEALIWGTSRTDAPIACHLTPPFSKSMIVFLATSLWLCLECLLPSHTFYHCSDHVECHCGSHTSGPTNSHRLPGFLWYLSRILYQQRALRWV
jgi:hypothetical protein